MDILRHISNVSWNICMQYLSKLNFTCIYYVFVLKIFFVLMCNQRQVWVRMLLGSYVCDVSEKTSYNTAEGWREICTFDFSFGSVSHFTVVHFK